MKIFHLFGVWVGINKKSRPVFERDRSRIYRQRKLNLITGIYILKFDAFHFHKKKEEKDSINFTQAHSSVVTMQVRYPVLN